MDENPELRAQLEALQEENAALTAKVERIAGAHGRLVAEVNQAVTDAIEAAAKVSFVGQLTPGLIGITISTGLAFGTLIALEAWSDDTGETVARLTVKDMFGAVDQFDFPTGQPVEVISQ